MKSGRTLWDTELRFELEIPFTEAALSADGSVCSEPQTVGGVLQGHSRDLVTGRRVLFQPR